MPYTVQANFHIFWCTGQHVRGHKKIIVTKLNFKVIKFFVIFSEKYHFCKMVKMVFLEIWWFYKIHIFHNLRDPQLKMKYYILVYIKIYGGNINVYTMCTLCVYYYFPKNNENCKFCEMIIFNQNRKCEQNVTIIVLMKTMCVTLKKHWIHISVHRNSRRKTLCLISFTQSHYITFF